MLLFKPVHIPLILDGTKTQTRRLWKRSRVKVGAVHKCYTKMPWQTGPFARIKIRRWWLQPIGKMSHKELNAEGQSFPGERGMSSSAYTLEYRRRLFLETVETINKKAVGLDTPLHAVEFRRLVGVVVGLCPYEYQECQLFAGASCPVKGLEPLWPPEVARSMAAGCYFRGGRRSSFEYKRSGYGFGAPGPDIVTPVGAQRRGG